MRRSFRTRIIHSPACARECGVCSNPLDNRFCVCYNRAMKSNYRIPPTSTSDNFAMLRFFGCSADPVPDDSNYARRNIPYSIRVFDSSRLPRLSCPLTNNPNGLIVLSFPGPPGFGLQSFRFHPESLLSAVKDGGGQDEGFSSFAEDNPFVSFILANFNISPSIINRVYNHKRGYFKLQLQPSVFKFNRNVRNKNK